jgi:hypothetical protein
MGSNRHGPISKETTARHGGDIAVNGSDMASKSVFGQAGRQVAPLRSNSTLRAMARKTPGDSLGARPTGYPRFLATASSMRHAGATTDEWLQAIRDDGATIIDSVKVVRQLLGVSLGEAKPIIDESPVWSDVRESNRRVRAQIERMVEEDRLLDI